MSADEPTPRRIAIEILVYAAIVLLVGSAYVAERVWREGTRILNHDPRAEPAQER